MRDIIWTIIIVWLIYKIVGLFKNNTTKTSFSDQPNNHQQTNTAPHSDKKDIKKALGKHLNKEGEYVDFEELK
jgi:hypothetical protein